MNYTKTDLIKRFVKETNVTQKDAAKITNAFLYCFRKFLEEMRVGDSLEVRDFGVFQMYLYKGRLNVRNPRTNERAIMPARRRLRFKPSIKMKNKFKKVI